jgi:hypothetical protein
MCPWASAQALPSTIELTVWCERSCCCCSDPDDAFSSVPYEKGFALLYELEQRVGGTAAMIAYLRAYVDHFQYQAITTEARVTHRERERQTDRQTKP